VRRALLAVGLTAMLLLTAEPVLAQDDEGVEVPTQDIVPEPNSGRAPSEAGDRGGALQLLLLGAVVVTIGGVTWHLVRQSRRARGA
jgi:hypothetical protein